MNGKDALVYQQIEPHECNSRCEAPADEVTPLVKQDCSKYHEENRPTLGDNKGFAKVAQRKCNNKRWAYEGVENGVESNE